MNDQPQSKEARPESKPAVKPVSPLPADTVAGAPAKEEPSAAQKLSPEEQWERFEKELKENDWGHQPC